MTSHILPPHYFNIIVFFSLFLLKSLSAGLIESLGLMGRGFEGYDKVPFFGLSMTKVCHKINANIVISIDAAILAVFPIM